MGEVHVKVRLSNAADVEYAEKGLLDPVTIRSCEVDALVDTGSTRSFISTSIADKLGLVARLEAHGIMADGTRVKVGVTTGILFEIEGREAIEDAYILGDQVLIGQTTLQATDLLVDCTNHKVIPRHAEGHIVRV